MIQDLGLNGGYSSDTAPWMEVLKSPKAFQIHIAPSWQGLSSLPCHRTGGTMVNVMTSVEIDRLMRDSVCITSLKVLQDAR